MAGAFVSLNSRTQLVGQNRLERVLFSPIGSIVRFSSENIGLVVEQNPSSSMTPRINIFFSNVTHVYTKPKLSVSTGLYNQ